MHSKICMAVLFLLLVPGVAICETVNWTGYQEGTRLAKKESKKIFLHFKADWCGYCKKMEKTTFQDKTVIEFLNRHFISIKVDGDKESSLAKAYKVKGYPANRFLDETSTQIHRLPGFIDPMTFLFFLEYIQTDSYKTMSPMQYYKSR